MTPLIAVIRSIVIGAAIVAAIVTSSVASAQPLDAPAQGWTCHAYGRYFWQWHCHY